MLSTVFFFACGMKSAVVNGLPSGFFIGLPLKPCCVMSQASKAKPCSMRGPRSRVPLSAMYRNHRCASTHVRFRFASAIVRPPIPCRTRTCHSDSEAVSFPRLRSPRQR